MYLSSLIQAVETIAPLSGAAAWDTSGLQVASQKKTCSALAVCLDPSPASITTALQLGCDCIVSHHPLALHPTLPNAITPYHTSLRLLLAHDIPLYAAHTSLDSNLAGPAGWLAEELRLMGLKSLEPLGNDPYKGFGAIGNLHKPTRTILALKKLFDYIPEDLTTVVGTFPTSVQKIAYCTGSGGSLLSLAEKAGADIYVTGDIKYHTALDASICVLDVGHHSLEEEMMRRFSDLLATALSTISVTFIPSHSPFRPLSQVLKEEL